MGIWSSEPVITGNGPVELPDLSSAHEIARALTRPKSIPLPKSLSDEQSVDDTAVRVARALQALRIERGLSQRALAKTAEIDPSYVSKIEHAAVSPVPWGVLDRLTRALGLRLADFCQMLGVLDPDTAEFVAASDAARRFLQQIRELQLGDDVWSFLGRALHDYVRGDRPAEGEWR